MSDTKTNRVIHHSIDIKDSFWEEIKEQPEKLGKVLKGVLNSVLDTHMYDDQERPKYAFTKFEVMPMADLSATKLIFRFECYDIADEEEKKKFLELIPDDERAWYE